MSVKSLKDGDAGVYGLLRNNPVIIGEQIGLDLRGLILLQI